MLKTYYIVLLLWVALCFLPALGAMNENENEAEVSLKDKISSSLSEKEGFQSSLRVKSADGTKWCWAWECSCRGANGLVGQSCDAFCQCWGGRFCQPFVHTCGCNDNSHCPDNTFCSDGSCILCQRHFAPVDRRINDMCPPDTPRCVNGRCYDPTYGSPCNGNDDCAPWAKNCINRKCTYFGA